MFETTNQIIIPSGKNLKMAIWRSTRNVTMFGKIW